MHVFLNEPDERVGPSFLDSESWPVPTGGCRGVTSKQKFCRQITKFANSVGIFF